MHCGWDLTTPTERVVRDGGGGGRGGGGGGTGVDIFQSNTCSLLNPILHEGEGGGGFRHF